MNNTKSISVVIPNFNGKSLLKRYLPPLVESLSNSKLVSDWEIIIADDASTDDSIKFLYQNFPSIIVLQNEINAGFSITCNKGIFAATKELVFVLNSDMYVPLDLFDALCPVFFNNKDAFGVFPTVKDITGDNILEAQKYPQNKSGSIHYVDNFIQDKLSYSLYLCGGNALIDREKLFELKGYNTIYSPFYFEDFDLSLRAWRKGWKSYYCPETYCLHCHSATVNENFSKTFIEETFTRNKLIFNYLYTEGLQHKLFILSMCFKSFKYMITPTKSKKVFLRATWQFINKFTEINKQRKSEYKPLNKYFDSIFVNKFTK